MERTIRKFVRHPWKMQLAQFTPCLIIALLGAILVPFVPIFYRSMITKAFIFFIFAFGLNLAWGYTGLISLGHAAFFGVAGYTTGILIIRFGIESFWLVAPISILMATLVAAVFGVIALRVSGTYFLLVTLALGQLVYSIAMKWTPVTGGSNGLVGIPPPALGIPIAWTSTSYFYFVFLFFIICSFILNQIVNSPFGHALQGIRESEPRMRSLGYNTWLYKYIAFIIAGLFAGVAGVLFAYYLGMMSPSYCSVTTSTLVALMIIMGGKRVFWGPAVGATVIIFLEYFSSIFVPERWPLILGGAFVVSVMFIRQGISIYLIKLWEKVR